MHMNSIFRGEKKFLLKKRDSVSHAGLSTIGKKAEEKMKNS